MRGDVQPAREIEAVGAEALDAGVEVELVAARGPGLPDEPREQFLAEALRTETIGGDEVVDVQKFSPREIFRDAIAGGGFDGFAIGEKGEREAVALLAADLRDELRFAEMRAQLDDDWI